MDQYDVGECKKWFYTVQQILKLNNVASGCGPLRKKGLCLLSILIYLFSSKHLSHSESSTMAFPQNTQVRLKHEEGI